MLPSLSVLGHEYNCKTMFSCCQSRWAANICTRVDTNFLRSLSLLAAASRTSWCEGAWLVWQSGLTWHWLVTRQKASTEMPDTGDTSTLHWLYWSYCVVCCMYINWNYIYNVFVKIYWFYRERTCYRSGGPSDTQGWSSCRHSPLPASRTSSAPPRSRSLDLRTWWGLPGAQWRTSRPEQDIWPPR